MRIDEHVRNPVLALRSAARLNELPPETRALLGEILAELSLDARARAEHSWIRHKAPMAAYWKAVAVYTRHIALALKRKQP